MNSEVSRKDFLRLASAGGGAVAAAGSRHAAPEPPPDDRYTRGLAKLAEIDGEVGRRVIESLAPVAPDLGRYVIEFPFGDVYSRPGLTLKEREIATIAALAALGHARPQLKVHINGALNVGCTPQEVVEIFIQMAVYAGFPAALNAVFAAHEVFQERGLQVTPPTKP